MTDQIDKILNFDAFAEAEKITGKSYKEDKETEALGFISHVMNGQTRNALMLELDDTLFSDSIERYTRIIKEVGFIEILIEPFIDNYDDDKRKEEYLYVYFQPGYGILLVFTSFRISEVAEPSVNGGKYYYNWQPNLDEEGKPVETAWHATSSGGYRDGWIWSGDHDCREAVKHNINKLLASGKFVTPWVDEPWTWFVNYTEEYLVREYDFQLKSKVFNDINKRKMEIVIKLIKEKTGQDLLSPTAKRLNRI